MLKYPHNQSFDGFLKNQIVDIVKIYKYRLTFFQLYSFILQFGL